MKFLSKKIRGIPVAAIVALMIIGIVSAAYVVSTIDSTTTIKESISVSETEEFEEDMYPGETNSWTFKVSNEASFPYSITYTCTDRPGENTSITGFTINGIDYINDLNDGDNNVTIDIGTTVVAEVHNVEVTITAEKDAVPGDVSVGFSVARS